ncbi:MAG: NPCBM/NEW2 domain-containing protein [Planctomycetia bacterium]|nr:NPCBM/NEW2 domain-containing protein [Planctomycetia bacterium]
MGTPVEGPAFRGHLVAAEGADWKFRFAEAGAQREIAAADLALWGNFVEPTHGWRILLAGGGLISLDTVQIKNEQLHGESQLLGTFDLPLELIAGIVFRPPLDRTNGDQLTARIAAPAGQSDRVLLDNGDELTGTITSLEEKVLGLQTEADKVDVEIKSIAAVIFNPTLIHKPRPSGLVALVGFGDGSRVTAIAITATKNSAQIKLAGGALLKASTDAIVALQPLGGGAVYLSDLKPASYRHIPYLQLSWPFYADRSVLGGQLRAGGKLYAKGLGMHSPARITYDFDRPYRRFETEVAIDTEAGSGGSAVFRVFADDGSGKWQERATSETVRGGEAPVPMSVDVTGAKRISLLVDFADHGDELDHADWLNARLVR